MVKRKIQACACVLCTIGLNGHIVLFIDGVRNGGSREDKNPFIKNNVWMTDEELRSTAITHRRLLSCIITVLFEATSTRLPALHFATRSTRDARARITTLLLTHRSMDRSSENAQCYIVTELTQGIALSFDPVAITRKEISNSEMVLSAAKETIQFPFLPLLLFFIVIIVRYDWRLKVHVWNEKRRSKLNVIAHNG